MVDLWRSSEANTESSWDELEQHCWWFRRLCIAWNRRSFGQQKLMVRWTAEVQMRVWGVKVGCVQTLQFLNSVASYNNAYRRLVATTRRLQELLKNLKKSRYSKCGGISWTATYEALTHQAMHCRYLRTCVTWWKIDPPLLDYKILLKSLLDSPYPTGD